MNIHTDHDENSPGDRWVNATLDLLGAQGIAGADARTALASFGRRLNDTSTGDLMDSYGPDAVRVAEVMRWHLGNRTQP